MIIRETRSEVFDSNQLKLFTSRCDGVIQSGEERFGHYVNKSDLHSLYYSRDYSFSLQPPPYRVCLNGVQKRFDFEFDLVGGVRWANCISDTRIKGVPPLAGLSLGVEIISSKVMSCFKEEWFCDQWFEMRVLLGPEKVDSFIDISQEDWSWKWFHKYVLKYVYVPDNSMSQFSVAEFYGSRLVQEIPIEGAISEAISIQYATNAYDQMMKMGILLHSSSS